MIRNTFAGGLFCPPLPILAITAEPSPSDPIWGRVVSTLTDTGIVIPGTSDKCTPETFELRSTDRDAE